MSEGMLLVDEFSLVLRQNLGIVIVKVKLAGNRGSRALAVACHHYKVGKASLTQCLDNTGSLLLYRILYAYNGT